jgi:hypothetical protein
MKNLFIVTICLFALPALADLKTITCKNADGDKAVLKPISSEILAQHKGYKNSKAVYQISVDSGLSVSYLGEITEDEDRWVSYDAKASTQTEDALSDWDGNSGIDFSMPADVILGKIASGTEFKAHINVYYDDISEGENPQDVTCSLAP